MDKMRNIVILNVNYYPGNHFNSNCFTFLTPALKIETFLGHEMATHVHKVTSVPVFYRLDLMILMGVNPLLGPLEGWTLLMTKKGQTNKSLQSE